MLKCFSNRPVGDYWGPWGARLTPEPKQKLRLCTDGVSLEKLLCFQESTGGRHRKQHFTFSQKNASQKQNRYA